MDLASITTFKSGGCPYASHPPLAAADPDMTANPGSASETTKLFSKIKTYPTGKHPTSVHLTGGCLMGVYLTGVYVMGVCLMGVYLTGVHVIGVHLTGYTS
jgi:hypothetical protein